DDRVRIWRLNAINEGAKHRSAWTYHALGRMHDALDRVRHIGRGEGRPIVPLDACMQAERERLSPVADLPGIGQFGDEDFAFGIVRAGANQAIVGGSSRGVDPAKGGLMHIVEGDFLIAYTQKLAAVTWRFTVRCGES